jgi:hypothetical protein
MNVFEASKKFLADHIMDVYVTRSQEIETAEYPTHYFNMGYALKQLEETTSLSKLLLDLKYGAYENVGYFKDDEDNPGEDVQEQFLSDVYLFHINSKK